MKLPKLPSVPALKPKKSDQPSESQYFTVIDVGASAVRAAIIEAQPDGIHILGYGYVPQQPSTMNAGLIANLDVLVETMDQASSKAIDQAGVLSEQLILGLGGALVSGVSTLARLNRPNAKDKIDHKELKLILERVTQNVLADNQETVAKDMAITADQVRLVNAGVTRFSLDGYTVTSPINFAGKEVEVSLFTAYVADQTVVALQQILNQLNVDLSSLTSEAYALAEAAISVVSKPQQANAIVIDIGSGTTTVTLVESGSVTNTRTFPIAGRAITTRLAKQYSMTMDEAEKLKIDYNQKAISATQEKTIKPIIKEEVDIWLHGLSIALSQLDNENALPNQVYLSGGGSQLEDLVSTLGKEKWTKALGFSQQPTIEILHIDILPKLFDQTKSLSAADMSLAALSLFWLQRQQEDTEVASAFQDIVKQMS